MRDGTTEAARRKCQRIFGKHSKASELMQQGTDGEILVQISPLSFSRCSEYIISPQLVPYRQLSLVLPFLLVSDNESKTNKPPSHVLKAAAVICLPRFLSPSHFLFMLLEVCSALLFHNDANESQTGCAQACLLKEQLRKQRGEVQICSVFLTMKAFFCCTISRVYSSQCME